MPGMSDLHVHIFMSASSQAELMAPDATFESLEAKAAEQARLMLLRGFTAARDVGGPVLRIKRAIDQREEHRAADLPQWRDDFADLGAWRFPLAAGPFAALWRPDDGWRADGRQLIADGRDEVLTATRENLRGGASQIKVMAGGGAASAYDPLNVTQYTLDEMKAAVEAADGLGTYVMVHAYTPKAVRRAIEAGVKCIEHGQLLDEATIKLLGQRHLAQSADARRGTGDRESRDPRQEAHGH